MVPDLTYCVDISRISSSHVQTTQSHCGINETFYDSQLYSQSSVYIEYLIQIVSVNIVGRSSSIPYVFIHGQGNEIIL